MPIVITADEAMELAAAVEAQTGEYPLVQGFHGRETPGENMSLSYIGNNMWAFGFELLVLLAGRSAHAACQAGYTFVASDFVEEMRQLARTIRSPLTEVVGRELIYYWPTVELLDDDD